MQTLLVVTSALFLVQIGCAVTLEYLAVAMDSNIIKEFADVPFVTNNSLNFFSYIIAARSFRRAFMRTVCHVTPELNAARGNINLGMDDHHIEAGNITTDGPMRQLQKKPDVN